MQIVSEYSVAIIGILGVLAFAVSLITELLKDMPGIKKCLQRRLLSLYP